MATGKSGADKVVRWTGHEARILRDALRMSVRGFAEHLGVSDRTVSKWEAGGSGHVPVPDSQALLDTALLRADIQAQERFHTAVTVPAPRRVPPGASPFILVPSPEPNLVDRTSEHEDLVSLLVDASTGGGVSAVAVCGPGGFGKTTLATQVCHDMRITRIFPVILWVETGQGCTPARVVELISDLCVHLDGARPALTDPEQAGLHLARVLDDRRILLVIDNVWSAADLAPFLLGGSECARLITTRNLRVCPAGTGLMRLGPMSPGEIGELLKRSIPSLGRNDVDRLALRCGGWPLLASVVGSNLSADVAAGASPGNAVVEADEALRTFGPQAFDVWDADQRKNAIGRAIMSSIRSLEESVTVSGGSALQERYLALAIFPAATPVPLPVLTHWWCESYGWSPSAVRQFCRVLADRSLISAYLADQDSVLLHDVFRAYLRRMIGREWSALHRSFLDAFRSLVGGSWYGLGDEFPYLWKTLSYHLHEAGLDDELVSTLASPRYIIEKVSRLGHQSLAADRAILMLIDSGSVGHSRNGFWQSACAFAEAGYLLHDLRTEAEVAATLTVALLRIEGIPDPVAQLKKISAEAGSTVDVSWALNDQASDPRGHVGAIVTVATSQGHVVSAGEDGTVRLWDLDKRDLIRTFRGHTGWVFAVAMSADGQTVASAGEDRLIRLWRTGTGEQIGILAGHTRRIRSIAFADERGMIVSGAEDGHVYVWDLASLKLLHGADTPGCPVWSVAIGCAETVVAVGGEDEFVRLYDLDTGQLLSEKAAHRDWVRSVAFAAGAPALASGSGDKSVMLWNIDDRRLAPARHVELPRARVRCVVLSDQADRLLVSTEDAKVHLVPSNGPPTEIQMPEGVDWVRSAAFTVDGSIVAGCEDGGLRRWQPAHSDHVNTLASGSNTIWSTQFAGAGTLVLLGRADGAIEVRDTATSALRRTLSSGPGRVWSLAAGADHIAAASGDGHVRVWSLRDPRWHLDLGTGQQRTWSVAVAKTGSRLASSTQDGRIRVRDLPGGDVLWEQSSEMGRVRSMAFDAAGDLVAAGGGDGSVRLWRADTGEILTEWTNPAGWARTINLDASGLRAAVGSGTGDIYVRDLAVSTNIAHLIGHTGRVLMLGFAPSTDRPDRLVSAGADGTVRIWSISEQREIAKVRVDASLQCATFDADSACLLAASATGVVALTTRQS